MNMEKINNPKKGEDDTNGCSNPPGVKAHGPVSRYEAITLAAQSILDKHDEGALPDTPEIKALRDVVALLKDDAEPVLFVNPGDLYDSPVVGINAVRKDHQDKGKYYTLPLYAYPPKGDPRKAERNRLISWISSELSDPHRDEGYPESLLTDTLGYLGSL